MARQRRRMAKQNGANRAKSKTQTAKLTNKQINGKHVIKGLHTQCLARTLSLSLCKERERERERERDGRGTPWVVLSVVKWYMGHMGGWVHRGQWVRGKDHVDF